MGEKWKAVYDGYSTHWQGKITSYGATLCNRHRSILLTTLHSTLGILMRRGSCQRIRADLQHCYRAYVGDWQRNDSSIRLGQTSDSGSIPHGVKPPFEGGLQASGQEEEGLSQFLTPS